MNIISIIFIILYFIYIILGNHIIAKIIFNESDKFSIVPHQIIKRSIFITYISLLSVAYTLNYFSTTNWLISFILSTVSLVAFSIKWSSRGFVIPPNGNYYATGIIEHFLIIIPLLFLIHNLNFNYINYNKLIIFLLLLIIYSILHPILYAY